MDPGDRDDSKNQRPPADPAGGDPRQREQFEGLALPLLDSLYAIALQMVRDAARAEDLVQETYLRAWQNFDRFTPGTHFKAWMLKILTYLFLNERRSLKRRENSVDLSEFDVVDPKPAAEPPAGINTNWEKLYPEIVDDALKKALDRLKADHRAVFLLVTLGELSYQEVAEAMELPIGTVMSRLFRSRQQLQRSLADYAREHGWDVPEEQAEEKE